METSPHPSKCLFTRTKKHSHIFITQIIKCNSFFKVSVCVCVDQGLQLACKYRNKTFSWLLLLRQTCMCTYIMYLSVMSSFLWPYCFRTHFPFRLSPPIFLSRDRSTFSPTIITLSASILHIPISFFLHSLLEFPFYIHHMPSNQISLLAMQSIQGTHVSRAVYSMCDCSQHHKWEMSLKPFQMPPMTILLSNDNRFLCDLILFVLPGIRIIFT